MLELRMFGSFAMLRRKWTTTGLTMLKCSHVFARDERMALSTMGQNFEQMLFTEGFIFGLLLKV